MLLHADAKPYGWAILCSKLVGTKGDLITYIIQKLGRKLINSDKIFNESY